MSPNTLVPLSLNTPDCWADIGCRMPVSTNCCSNIRCYKVLHSTPRSHTRTLRSHCKFAYHACMSCLPSCNCSNFRCIRCCRFGCSPTYSRWSFAYKLVPPHPNIGVSPVYIRYSNRCNIRVLRCNSPRWSTDSPCWSVHNVPYCSSYCTGDCPDYMRCSNHCSSHTDNLHLSPIDTFRPTLDTFADRYPNIDGCLANNCCIGCCNNRSYSLLSSRCTAKPCSYGCKSPSYRCLCNVCCRVAHKHRRMQIHFGHCRCHLYIHPNISNQPRFRRFGMSSDGFGCCTCHTLGCRARSCSC